MATYWPAPYDTRPRRERRAKPWHTLTDEERRTIVDAQLRVSVVDKASRFVQDARRERRRLTLRNKRRTRKNLPTLAIETVYAEKARWN